MAKINLNNKKVLISGFSSGIGKEITRLLVERYNCQIFGIARDENKIISFVKELKKPELIRDYLLFDVSDENGWISLTEKLKEIDFTPEIVINCAGILPKFSSFSNTETDSFKKVIDVNFLSCVYSAKHLLPIMEKNGFPIMLNVSSSSAIATFSGVSAYSSSKSALKNFSLCLSAEYGKRGYVGCVCPGFSSTDIYRNQNASQKDLKLIKRFSTSPKKVAQKTLNAIKRKRKLTFIGYDAKLMNFFYKIMPITSTKVVTAFMRKSQLEIFKNL